MSAHVYLRLEDLPPPFEALFEDPAEGDIFRSRAWLENYLANGLPAGDKLRLYTVADDLGEPLAVVVGFMSRLYQVHGRSRVLYFHQSDGLPFKSVMASAATSPDAVLAQVIRHALGEDLPYDVLRFGPFDRAGALFSQVKQTLRDHGFLMQDYYNFSIWHEPTAGLSWQDYLQSRSARFRQNLRRRARRLLETGRARFELITSREGIDRGLADFEQVFSERRLQGEVTPHAYIPSIMRCAAESGVLRLGLVHIDGEPAAYEFCIASGGVAHFTRTGYAERYRPLSVGNYVMQRVMEHVLDVDRVSEVNFGVGEFAYKQDWLSHRLDAYGIAAFNPRTSRGVMQAVRHIGGRGVKSPLRHIRNRLRDVLR